jgi:hypothetical protein
LDYDSEWSEVEEMIEEIKDEESMSIASIKEVFYKEILNNYGTFGLVFYRRISSSKFWKDMLKDLPLR